MGKIADYPAATTIGSTDILLLDGSKGTQKVSGQVASNAFGNLYGATKSTDIKFFKEDETSSEIKSSGWYRFLVREGNTLLRNYYICMDISLMRAYGDDNPEVHRFVVANGGSDSATWQRLVIKPIIDNASRHFIKKVRICSDENGTYMDVYYGKDEIAANNKLHLKCFDFSEFFQSSKNFVKVQDEIKTTLLEHTFKAYSWMDGEDTWPLT